MHDFTVLVLPGAFATSVSATLDILGAAAAVAPRLKVSPPTWRVVSARAGPVPLTAGVTVQAQGLPRRAHEDKSTWIIPGLATETLDAIVARLAKPDSIRIARALKAHLAAGGAVAASCSAVFLLQSCGALAGRRVTTSWWLAPALQQLEP
ncbi:MAG: GlxA family transcriptional regulator, partial [Ramlibacter sp.]